MERISGKLVSRIFMLLLSVVVIFTATSPTFAAKHNYKNITGAKCKRHLGYDANGNRRTKANTTVTFKKKSKVTTEIKLQYKKGKNWKDAKGKVSPWYFKGTKYNVTKKYTFGTQLKPNSKPVWITKGLKKNTYYRFKVVTIVTRNSDGKKEVIQYGSRAFKFHK